jgi:CSLREA domain-containing protein
MNRSIRVFSQLIRRLPVRALVSLTFSLLLVLVLLNPTSHSASVSRHTRVSKPGVAVPAATTFTVNTTSDLDDSSLGDGHCDTDGNLGNGDQCTLRAAIQEGKVGFQGHSINFSLPAGSVITLNTQLPAFQNNVTIVGSGSNQLTIQRSTAGGTPNFTIFSFVPINGNFNNSISGLTIANGNNPNSGGTFPQGGCLFNMSPVISTLTDIALRGCTGTNGGAINNGGTLTLTDSTIDGNTASGGAGGGIFNNGDGFFLASGLVTLTRTTVSNNTADSQGGGIANGGSKSSLTLTNSTVSGNTATGTVAAGDGGITNISSDATLTLDSSTVTANVARANASGGIGNTNGGTANIRSSIIARNTGVFADARGVFNSQGYNLIGLSAASGLNNGVNNDQVGTPGAAIDPLLGSLADNGGATKTHALLVGSPAIDAGNSSQTTDQRGRTRPTDDPNVTNASGGNGADVGAYETNPFQVNTTADADDGACTALGIGNGCTLREAIIAANSTPGEISFASALTSGGPATINLLTALPAISSRVVIEGPGASLLTLQRSTAGGTPDFRVFLINSGKSLAISGVTVSRGNAVGTFPNNQGGNFYNDHGTLTISNCVVKDAVNGSGIANNSGTIALSSSVVSGNNGGGLRNTSPQFAANSPAAVTINNSTFTGNLGTAINNLASIGPSSSPVTVVINNSTVSGNDANGAGSGSAISNSSATGGIATITINNSTISGNANSSNGMGGIYNIGIFAGSNPTVTAVFLTNSTVFGNSAASGGGAVGGISNVSNSCSGCTITVKLRNSIVAGNTVAGNPSDIQGSIQIDTSSSFNLIGTGGSGGLVNGVNGNQVGVADAKLGPLANNGGPTQTHALLSGSPALDAGDNCVTQSTHCGDVNLAQLLTDQRGFNRIIDGPDADTTATVDIGAFEGQTPLSNLPDTSTNEDTQLTVGFDPGDPSTIGSVTATSSNATLVPNDTGHLNASTTGSNGSLVINPAANLSGTTNITVTINRTGGGSDVKTFMLTVNAVNDAPTFTKGPDQVINEDAGAQTISNWATNISPGPADESGQTLTIQVVGNSNPGLFSAAPVVNLGGTLSYTPAANANGTATITVTFSDNGGTANGGVDTSSQSFIITVNSVNDAPSFTKGTDRTVNEDAPLQNIPGWATNISAGPANESGQTLSFTVTNNTNAALFSSGPTVSSNGQLSFTPAANANGSATITIVLKDSGGTANGGVDTSSPQTFVITVTPVNDAPSFTKGANQTVLEDAGAQTVTGWATNILAGPADESTQTLSFQVTNNTRASLFSVAPAISATGTLTFTPAADANGSATITINLKDNGGTANGGTDTSVSQTFTISVTAVNDAPTFTKGADQAINKNAGAQTINNWATNISPGPGDEAGQTVAFQVTSNNNPAMFTVQPAISPAGTLTFTPNTNVADTAKITIVLKDSGGTANNGIDTSAAQSFMITTNADGGSFRFVSSAGDTQENSGFVTVPVLRTGDASRAVSVDYATSGDNGLPCSGASSVASSKCDFTAAFGTLSFAAGETSKTITILINQDSYVEIPEDFTLTLSNPTNGAALSTLSQTTITIHDDDTQPGPNAIDDANIFVWMHYHDFLNREPDQSGLDFWTNQITSCGSDAQCKDVKRINVSAAFFLSIEFQQTGYLVERMYKTAYGDATGTSTLGGSHQLSVPIVRFTEFLKDTQRIGQGVVVLAPGWEQALENNKQAYAGEVVQTVRFISAFPTTMTPAQFVDKLNQNAGNVLSLSERTTAINLFSGATDSSNTTARAQALRQVAEDQDLYNAEVNRAFVLTEFFGYLRRNPNDLPDQDYTGYDFWLIKLNQFNGNYIDAEMVKAFIASSEYRQRFGP